MAELNRQDMEILGSYAKDGNRVLYWNYLAQHQGNDGYGLLALGVVRNDNMPGAIANAFAQNHVRVRDGRSLTEREWENFGQDLVKQDFGRRQFQMADKRPDLALNLPVYEVQLAHDGGFRNAGIDPNAWTPRPLLEAARRHGGEQAAEGVWRQMLDNRAWGLKRLTATMSDIAVQYNDAQLPAASYMADLALATTAASQDRSHADPNVIGGNHFHYMYDPREREWSSVAAAPIGPAVSRVTDQRTLDELDDARAVRLERQEKSREFHSLDPHREILKSPRSLADADQALVPETQTAKLGKPAGSRDALDDMFTRLTDAAMKGDVAGMRVVERNFLRSEEGQNWLQVGRDYNEAQRQVELAAQQAQQARQAEQAALREAAPVRRGPVMSM